MIRNDSEFNDKLQQLSRLYKAVREQFGRLTVTQENAPQLLISTGKITNALTNVLSEIEEYSGAAEIRRLTYGLAQVREERNRSVAEDQK